LLPAAALACRDVEPTAAPSLHSLAAEADVGTVAKPDQSLIAYVSGRAGVTDLYIMDVANGRSHWLTRDRATASAPVWSPDGTQIAFSSNRDGLGANIWVMNADGSNPVQLTGLTDAGTSYNPAWSSDGKKIAFASFRNSGQDLYVMNADGTGLTRITDGGPAESRPRWSTRGIVFHANASGTPSIFLVNPDGTGLTQLTRGSSWSYDAAWKP
jgi:TolB protein